MQPTSIILAVAFFSAKTFAQRYEGAVSTFLSDYEGAVSTLLSDYEVHTELARLPSSVASQIASAAPKIEGEIVNYVSSLIGGAPFITAVSKLNPILPSEAKTRIASDPSGFVVDLITATTPPVWADAIPTDVVSYLRSVGEDIDSIISKEVTIPPLPLPSLRTTLGPRPGSAGTTTIPTTQQTIVATSLASIITNAPASSGVLPSSVPSSVGTGGGVSSGTGTGRVVTPSGPSLSSFVPNSASRWNTMTGAMVALMAIGVGALLLA